MTLPAAACLLSLLPLASPPQARRPRVAVMDVRGVQGVSEGTSAMLGELITTEVARLRRYDVVSRSDIVNLLGFERQKQLLACNEDASCMAEIGGALGVDYLLSTQVGVLGTRYRVALSLQDVRKARTVARQGTFCDRTEDALAQASEKAVRDLFDEAEKSLGPMAPALTASAPGEGLSRRTWGFIAGGSGLALALGGGVFDFLAKKAYDDEKRAAAIGDAPAYASAKSSAKSRALAANILYVSGAAGIGVGAWLLFFGGEKPPLALSVHPAPGGALARLSMDLP